jgi:protein SCO1
MLRPTTPTSSLRSLARVGVLALAFVTVLGTSRAWGQSAVSAASGRTADQAGVIASKELPEEAQNLEPVEKLGEQVPLDLQLIDQHGTAVRLGELFDGRRPVILVPAFYTCPVACPVMIGKVRDSINGLDHKVGKDFRLVVVSFDETNTTAQAKTFADDYFRFYTHKDEPIAAEGWHFLTGAGAVTKQLMQAVGYPYKYLPETGQYSHPFMWMVLTPEGKVARYFYGFDFPAQQTRLALLEASSGEIAQSLGDRLLLYCFHYDPKRGAYTLVAMRVMQLSCLAVLTGLALLVGSLKLAEVRRRRAWRASEAGDQPARAFAQDHQSSRGLAAAGSGASALSGQSVSTGKWA